MSDIPQKACVETYIDMLRKTHLETKKEIPSVSLPLVISGIFLPTLCHNVAFL